MFFSNVFGKFSEKYALSFYKILGKLKKKSGAVINNNQVDDTKIAKLRKI